MCIHMSNLTVVVPEELKEEMARHQEVNWSAVIRKALQDHLRKLAIADALASSSRLTPKDVEELDRLVKKGLAKRHGSA